MSSSINTKSPHVLITGSTSGIGWGLARGFAAKGFNVTLNGLADANQVEKLLVDLRSEFGVQAWYSPANMMRANEIRDMVKEAETHGGLDVLVNNAGIQHVSPVEDFPDEKWDAITAINLSSVFHATKAAIPGMKARGFGRIINIASVHGLVASPYKSAYVAAKHGVIGFTKSIALELADTPLTCNAICPGYVRTPLVEGQISQQAKAHGISEERVVREVILAAQPKKEFIEIEALAEMALLLAGPAGKAITGVSMTLDGGWTAR
jgi:3-hydroxybutyrate dehydrogenase